MWLMSCCRSHSWVARYLWWDAATYAHMNTYIYIYIEREREREWKSKRERMRERERERKRGFFCTYIRKLHYLQVFSQYKSIKYDNSFSKDLCIFISGILLTRFFLGSGSHSHLSVTKSLGVPLQTAVHNGLDHFCWRNDAYQGNMNNQWYVLSVNRESDFTLHHLASIYSQNKCSIFSVLIEKGNIAMSIHVAVIKR